MYEHIVIPVSTRATRKANLDREFYVDLGNRSVSIDITQDSDGRWHTNCYDSRGYLIGGIGPCSELISATRVAHDIAVRNMNCKVG